MLLPEASTVVARWRTCSMNLLYTSAQKVLTLKCMKHCGQLTWSTAATKPEVAKGTALVMKGIAEPIYTCHWQTHQYTHMQAQPTSAGQQQLMMAGCPEQ